MIIINIINYDKLRKHETGETGTISDNVLEVSE